MPAFRIRYQKREYGIEIELESLSESLVLKGNTSDCLAKFYRDVLSYYYLTSATNTPIAEAQEKFEKLPVQQKKLTILLYSFFLLGNKHDIKIEACEIPFAYTDKSDVFYSLAKTSIVSLYEDLKNHEASLLKVKNKTTYDCHFFKTLFTTVEPNQQNISSTQLQARKKRFLESIDYQIKVIKEIRSRYDRFMQSIDSHIESAKKQTHEKQAFDYAKLIVPAALKAYSFDCESRFFKPDPSKQLTITAIKNGLLACKTTQDVIKLLKIQSDKTQNVTLLGRLGITQSGLAKQLNEAVQNIQCFRPTI